MSYEVAIFEGMPRQSKARVRHSKYNKTTYTTIHPVKQGGGYRTLTAWVADMLKVRGRAHCNQESTYLIKIVVANPIIILEAIVRNLAHSHSPKLKGSSHEIGQSPCEPGNLFKDLGHIVEYFNILGHLGKLSGSNRVIMSSGVGGHTGGG